MMVLKRKKSNVKVKFLLIPKWTLRKEKLLWLEFVTLEYACFDEVGTYQRWEIIERHNNKHRID